MWPEGISVPPAVLLAQQFTTGIVRVSIGYNYWLLAHVVLQLYIRLCDRKLVYTEGRIEYALQPVKNT